MKQAFIFLAGEIKNYDFFCRYPDMQNNGNVVICADGGYFHAKKLKIIPQFLVGDMDSIDEKTEDFSGMEIICCPCEKDYTDGQFAVELAIKSGCEKITLFGALGGRFDHQIGNLLLLKTIQSGGATGEIIDSNCKILLVNEFARFECGGYRYISFVPLSENVNGITLTGLKYPLNKANITQSDFCTMSNEFADKVATITVDEGYLAAVLTAD